MYKMKILYFHCEKLKNSHGFDSLYAHINDLFAYKNYFFTKQTEQLLFYLGSVHLIIVRGDEKRRVLIFLHLVHARGWLLFVRGQEKRRESFTFPSFGSCQRVGRWKKRGFCGREGKFRNFLSALTQIFTLKWGEYLGRS